MITFEGVEKRYPDGTVAVEELSMELATGRITVFVGPSGCGKTTALRMINRMLDPTGGRILLDGRDVKQIDPPTLRRGIGYVIQQAGLFPHRTIVDNIATVPYLLGGKRAEARPRALELMERVGLDTAMAKRYPYQLSGGQQQRVGVARALAADPPVLLMDEPFSAVDPVVRVSLQNELLRLQGELHKTVVLVTHDVDEAIKLGDMVAVFQRGGRLAQYAEPEELLALPASAYVEDFLGYDRGIRRLSFFGARGLRLSDDVLVADSASILEAHEMAVRAGERWLLAVTAERRPLGWLDTGSELRSETVGEVDLAPLGHVVQLETDSLRAALDAAVLSPSGRVVGVDGQGRAVGVASYQRLGEMIQTLQDGEGGQDHDG